TTDTVVIAPQQLISGLRPAAEIAYARDLAQRGQVPYFDVASDVVDRTSYGGRVCICWNGDGCLYCMCELDQDAVRRYLQSKAERENDDAIYGVRRDALGGTGPSVVSLNGVVASLATTEFMAAVTGLRDPRRLLIYKAHTGVVTSSLDPPMS